MIPDDKTPHTLNYALCPKCRGQKHVQTPPWVAGDMPVYTISSTQSYPCPVCEGRGVLIVPTALTPPAS